MEGAILATVQLMPPKPEGSVDDKQVFSAYAHTRPGFKFKQW